jgi:ADP-ribose pyrophosphatase
MLLRSTMALPPLPRSRLLVLDARPQRPGDDRPFLTVLRQRVRVELPDGTTTEAFDYDTAARERLDAVIVVPHYVDRGARHVYLRSALRPPVATRPMDARPFPERDTLGLLWEVPAGLVEVDERTPEGLRRAAARELHEETGFAVAPERLAELGPSTFPAPGMIGERHFFFHVEVDPRTRVTPPEDGSPLERGAAVVAVSLADALDLVRAGEVEDAKTEIALRRLAEI